MTKELQYLWIGQPVILAKDLNWTAKIVLATVAMLGRKNATDPGVCALSARQLADLLELPETTLRENLEKLIAKRYLTAAPVYQQGRLLTRQLTVAQDLTAKPNQTIKLPAALLRRQDLTGLEKALVAYISGFGQRSSKNGRKTYGFFQFNATIAAFFGTTPGSIKTMLCRLKRKGLIEPDYFGKQQPGTDLKYNGQRIIKLRSAALGSTPYLGSGLAGVAPRGRVDQSAPSRSRGLRSGLRDPATPLTTPRGLVDRSVPAPAAPDAESPTKPSCFALSALLSPSAIETSKETDRQTEKENNPRSLRCVDLFSYFSEREREEQQLEEELTRCFDKTLKAFVDQPGSTRESILFRSNASIYLTQRSRNEAPVECLKCVDLQKDFVWFAARCLGLDELLRQTEARVCARIQSSPYWQFYEPIIELLDERRMELRGDRLAAPALPGGEAKPPTERVAA